MKRFLALMMALVLIFAFVSCDNGNDDEAPSRIESTEYGSDRYYEISSILEEAYANRPSGGAYELESCSQEEAEGLCMDMFGFEESFVSGKIRNAVYFLDETGDNFDFVVAFDCTSESYTAELRASIDAFGYIKMYTEVDGYVVIAATSVEMLEMATKDSGGTTQGSGTVGTTQGSGNGNTNTDHNHDGSNTDAQLVATHIATIEVENYGTIVLDLYGNIAPITVENFASLANSGFYNGLTFHRIMEGFVMQGGCPNGNGTGSTTAIKGEFSNNGVNNPISHKRGVISMARRGGNPDYYYYDTGSCQFFIMHADYEGLDGNYASFGIVTSGMDVVDRICTEAEPTDSNGTIPSQNQPRITSITVVKVK